MQFLFYMYKYIYLKQEKLEMDDIERKKKLVLKEKRIFYNFLTDAPTKMSQNIFAYSFVSENSEHFLYFEKKKTRIFIGGGSTPPPSL